MDAPKRDSVEARAVISEEIIKIISAKLRLEIDKETARKAVRELLPDDLPPYLEEELAYSIATHDSGNLEYCLIVANMFDMLKDFPAVLCPILKEDWHASHEYIVAIIDEQRYEPGIDFLYDAAIREYPYPIKDEFSSLGKKCAWALAGFGTEYALEKLQLLTHADDPNVAERARQLITGEISSMD